MSSETNISSSINRALKILSRWLRMTLISLAVVLGLCAALTALCVWLSFRELSPGYQARYFVPVIQALNTYHQTHGKYPTLPSELTPLLPQTIRAIDPPAKNTYPGYGDHDYNSGFSLFGTAGINLYYNTESSNTAYVLGRQIRDAWLYYKCDGHKGTWLYNAGGGDSPTVELQLSP
jgi:hypothetical protein